MAGLVPVREDVDPALQRTYSGPDAGVGAHYAWSGNRRAGSGSMEITSSTPDEIDLRLSFLKPSKATNDVTFTRARRRRHRGDPADDR